MLQIAYSLDSMCKARPCTGLQKSSPALTRSAWRSEVAPGGFSELLEVVLKGLALMLRLRRPMHPVAGGSNT